MSALALAPRLSTAVVAPSGSLDALTAPRIRELILDVGMVIDRVIVDLTDVHDMDAAGLSVLIGCRRRLRSAGVRLEILGAHAPAVRRTLAVTRFALMFDLVEEAA